MEDEDQVEEERLWSDIQNTQLGEEQIPKKYKRRRKKVGSLSRQANRRIPPGSELTWLQNTSRNIKLLDEQRALDEEIKRSKKVGDKLPQNSQASQHSRQPSKPASSEHVSSQPGEQANQHISVNISPQSLENDLQIVKEEDIMIDID